MNKSRQFNIKLIENVRKHPCLYQDMTKEQQEAWKTISEQLGTPDHLVQDLWHRLRKQFTLSLRKNRKFDLDEHMEFLRPHLEIEAKAAAQEVASSTLRPGPYVEVDDTEHIDLVDDNDWNNYNGQASNSMPTKRKSNDLQCADIGAQYFANAVLDDAGSTKGPQKDFMFMLSSTLDDLTEEQRKKFKRKMFATITEISDES